MTDLSAWTPRPTPGLVALGGAIVRLEPLDWAVHGEGLFAAVGGATNGEIWTHMPVGPFADTDALRRMLEANKAHDGWRTMVVRAEPGGAVRGMATYMRIREAHGSAEIGCVAFGPKLRRTGAATETFRLMAAHVFIDLGYRRYEWKCNQANTASKRAAERFGFVFEGTFCQDMVAKGKAAIRRGIRSLTPNGRRLTRRWRAGLRRPILRQMVRRFARWNRSVDLHD